MYAVVTQSCRSTPCSWPTMVGSAVPKMVWSSDASSNRHHQARENQEDAPLGRGIRFEFGRALLHGQCVGHFSLFTVSLMSSMARFSTASMGVAFPLVAHSLMTRARHRCTGRATPRSRARPRPRPRRRNRARPAGMSRMALVSCSVIRPIWSAMRPSRCGCCFTIFMRGAKSLDEAIDGLMTRNINRMVSSATSAPACSPSSSRPARR